MGVRLRLGWKRALLLIAAVVVLATLVIALHAFVTERGAFVARHHAPRLSLRDFRIPGLVEASFRSRAGGRLKGYYAPPSDGIAVVLCHGSSGERSDLVEEARILAEAGVGVLVFDWPGHGESEGTVHWDEPERQALRGAVDWLVMQPGVSPHKIGAFGFSMGGYMLAQVAATDDRLRAVALAGTPPDAVAHLRWEYRRGGLLRQWPAMLAVHVSGMQPREQVPLEVVKRVAPRRLLLVAGSDDRSVPPWMTQQLYAAASEPKRLLVIQGAEHGGYSRADAGYAQTLRDFFRQLSE